MKWLVRRRAFSLHLCSLDASDADLSGADSSGADSSGADPSRFQASNSHVLWVAFVLAGICLCAGTWTGCTTQADLTWHQEEGYEWAELAPGRWGDVGFRRRDAGATGITFENRLGDEEIVDNRVLMNGSGVAAGDVDGDGLVDMYFTRLDGANALYKNMGGMRFKDITEEAGVGHGSYYSTGAVFADVDGDRDVDLLVATVDGGNALYMNDGEGRFQQKDNSGLEPGKGSTTMTLADIDGDSDLDLYVANYKEREVMDIYDMEEITLENITRRAEDGLRLVPPFDRHYRLFAGQGRPDARQLGERDELYMNDGDGTFTKVADPEQRFRDSNGEPEGINRDWSLTAKFHDINEDGLPDLYVCSDFWTPDRVWLNQGDGTFRSVDDRAIRKVSYSSMGVAFLDINRDGSDDIYVTEMLSPVHERRLRQMVNVSPFATEGDKEGRRQYVQNTLQLNRSDGTYAEIGYYAGVEATEWSWATMAVDVDLDGYEDLIVNTGHAYDVQDLDTQEALSQELARGSDMKRHLLEFPPLRLRNMALQNNGDSTFTSKGSDWGFVEEDISHGLATADFDNDGDLDLVANRLNQKAALYENTTVRPRIAVRLRGNSPNTQGVGATVELTGGAVSQRKEVEAGGNYVSGSDPVVVFAANPDKQNHRLEVAWPDGKRSVLDSVKANRVYRVWQSAATTGRTAEENKVPEVNTQFTEVSSRIGHAHHEDGFDDFRVQPLLPLKLSRLGPGISWIDFNQDGHDDLFVGAGKGGKLGVFLNDGTGQFSPVEVRGVSDQALGDQTAVLGWADRYGQHLVIGTSNYEQGAAGAPAAWHYTFDSGQLIDEEPIPGQPSATGPMAIADYDGDGDLDLFVGGRFQPAHYPQDADSRLFRSEKGSFQLDEANSRRLREAGLVTGAVFTDIDQDGDQDLLLSRAWDSLMLLENRGGRFVDVSADAGLDRFKGRWNGIATGDFNNDGRPDVVATNWGGNSIYQLDSSHPLRMYYSDFDRDGRVEILDAYYNHRNEAYVPRRQLYDLDEAMPQITRRIRTHEQYSTSSVGEILGTSIVGVPSKAVNTLEHTLFLNTGDGFTSHPLPSATQFTTAFGAEVADFNNDGHEDIFLSQNFFGQPATVPRQDAGRGALLEGNGHGQFTMISGRVNGIMVYGEQRGVASSDVNGDGKVDLAVSQNGEATKLYTNHVERSGVRVRLQGPDQNARGIGSSIRLIYHDGTKGPRREIQVGSGYWSQSSAAPVLGRAKRAVGVRITWFDGTTQDVSLQEGSVAPGAEGNETTRQVEVVYTPR